MVHNSSVIGLAVLLGLVTKQVGYTSAFVQFFMEEDVFVEMPKLFEKPGMVLKLKKYAWFEAKLPEFLQVRIHRHVAVRMGDIKGFSESRCTDFNPGNVPISSGFDRKRLLSKTTAGGKQSARTLKNSKKKSTRDVMLPCGMS